MTSPGRVNKAKLIKITTTRKELKMDELRRNILRGDDVLQLPDVSFAHVFVLICPSIQPFLSGFGCLLKTLEMILSAQP